MFSNMNNENKSKIYRLEVIQFMSEEKNCPKDVIHGYLTNQSEKTGFIGNSRYRKIASIEIFSRYTQKLTPKF